MIEYLLGCVVTFLECSLGGVVLFIGWAFIIIIAFIISTLLKGK
jgi:hypothetical protein